MMSGNSEFPLNSPTTTALRSSQSPELTMAIVGMVRHERDSDLDWVRRQIEHLIDQRLGGHLTPEEEQLYQLLIAEEVQLLRLRDRLA